MGPLSPLKKFQGGGGYILPHLDILTSHVLMHSRSNVSPKLCRIRNPFYNVQMRSFYFHVLMHSRSNVSPKFCRIRNPFYNMQMRSFYFRHSTDKGLITIWNHKYCNCWCPKMHQKKCWFTYLFRKIIFLNFRHLYSEFIFR